MTMWNLAALFFIIAVILLILSYYKKDTTLTLQEEVEQTSLDLYQENVQIKKRLDQIEKKLDLQTLTDTEGHTLLPGTINRVIALYTEGQTETEISEALDLREEDITHTIEDYIDKGSN
ncbi:MAG: hypothetical protein GX638_17700 [Crenarchaeota archaeon]|uniref:DUF2802 domain-containing protein n=1 Tax=Atopococcus tabaci TaxID=269774 RepID=A0AA43UBJ0_9LACT|nr:hypothetical protein [Atopococcus tabaci]NLE06622.1 hypothetical protein [Thermoproteota archaeon]